MGLVKQMISAVGQCCLIAEINLTYVLQNRVESFGPSFCPRQMVTTSGWYFEKSQGMAFPIKKTLSYISGIATFMLQQLCTKPTPANAVRCHWASRLREVRGP